MASFSGSSFLSSLDAALADIEPSRNRDRKIESSSALAAAAVLHTFDPVRLAGPDGELIRPFPSGVLGASYPTPGQLHKGLRSLRERVRKDALVEIGSVEKALQLLFANPERNMTTEQRMFEVLLTGQNLDLGSKTRSELNALRHASGWARSLGATDLPDETAIRRAQDYAAAVEPVEHLFVEAFVGREAEMQGLRRFVGIAEPSLWHSITSIFSSSENRLMMLDGVGGIGKTALLGHFLLRHRADDDGPLFPFAYFACDDHRVNIDAPAGILADAALQFERTARIANPDPDSQQMKAVRETRAMFERQSSIFVEQYQSLAGRKQDFSEQSDRQDASRQNEWQLAQSFAAVVEAASHALKRKDRTAPPTLIILDTFEEVQYRSPEALDQFWNIVADVLDRAPAFRLLISGRAPLHKPRSDIANRVLPLVSDSLPRRTDLDPDEIHLGKLSAEEAAQLLEIETSLTPRATRKVVSKIGCNPLNLRLAAEYLRRSGKERIDIDELDRLGFFRLGREMVRGVLYRRILDHIHDEDVRALAHPGMIVRRITSDIIQNVLGPGCELGPYDDERSDQLFAELKREQTLVKLDDDDSLRFRADVRQSMISLLQSDQPDRARRVHEAAIRYYTGKDDPVSVAEYLYHRLMSSDLENLSVDWNSQIEEQLRDGIDELPPESQIWLAQYMRIDLPEDVRERADIALWEQITGPRALLALQHESADSALSLLRERTERTPQSPLHAIEARCLLSMQLLEECNMRLEDALAGYPADGNPGRRAELIWLLYQARTRIGADDALEILNGLVDATSGLNSKIPHVQALSELCRKDQDDRTNLATSEQLSKVLRNLDEEEVYNEQDIVRTGLANVLRVAASTLGPQFRAVFTSLVDNLLMQGSLWTPDHLKVITDNFENAKHVQFETKIGAELRYLSEAITEYDRDTDCVEMLIGLAETCAGVLQKEGTDPRNPEVVAATDVLWLILQLETGDFSAATLGGIDKYREPWELSASVLATV